MLLVGKPGSGKTTLLKQLMTNPQMYYRKFDDVLLVSPSHAKMGVKVKNENTTANFDLDWIFEKLEKLNQDQLQNVFGHKLKLTAKDRKSDTGKLLGPTTVLGDQRSRWLLGDMFRPLPGQVKQEESKGKGKKVGAGAAKAKLKSDTADQVFIQKKYDELKKLPREQQEKTHKNILLVLDDVVGAIKKAEYDPRLAQLVMNRRHIVFNGTISIIVVTQKYTLVPGRIRSNANWLILYKLNPVDFETAYKDAIVMSVQKWRQLLDFVYGTDEYSKRDGRVKMKDEEQEQDEYGDETMKEQQPQKHHLSVKEAATSKKFENLGIWVELNMYFKNFKRVLI